MYQTPHGTKAVIFDLDDTLAPSKSPLDPSMATALVSLLPRLPVCLIWGGRFEQFQAQVLDQHHDRDTLKRPGGAGQCFAHPCRPQIRGERCDVQPCRGLAGVYERRHDGAAMALPRW